MVRWETETKESSEACRPGGQTSTSVHRHPVSNNVQGVDQNLKVSTYLHEWAVAHVPVFTLKNVHTPIYHIHHTTIIFFLLKKQKLLGFYQGIFSLQKTLEITDIKPDDIENLPILFKPHLIFFLHQSFDVYAILVLYVSC